MRQWLGSVLLILGMASGVAADSATHRVPDHTRQRQQWMGDRHDPSVVSGCLPTVPGGGGTTLPTMACEMYVRDSTTRELLYGNQATSTMSLSGGNGTYWLAMHKDRSTAVTNWTRQAATHYLWRISSTQPADPTDGTIFAKVTVAAGSITAVQRVYVRGNQRYLVVTDPPYLADPKGLSDSASAINQALVDAASGGYTVFVPCGTYKTTAQILMQSNTALVGAGRDCAIIKPDTGSTIPRPILASSVSYTTIRDLQVDCGDASIARQGIAALNTASYMTVDHVYVKNCGQYGILAHGDTSAAPYSSGGQGMVITNNLIDMSAVTSGNCTGLGTIALEYFPKGPVGFLADPGVLYEGNTVIAGNSIAGIKTNNATGTRITSNVITGATCTGSTGAIDVGPGTQNTTVVGNTIKSTRLGIVFGGLPRSNATGGNELRTTKTSFVGNILNNVTTIGFFSSDGADDVLIQNNNVSLDTGAPSSTQCLSLTPTAAASGGAAFNRLRVLGNTCVGFETGVLLPQDSGATLGHTDVQVNDNLISTSNVTGQGIYIERADGAQVVGNKIIGEKIGININVSSAGVLVANNVMHDINMTDVASQPCVAIVGNRPIITDNVCYQGTGGHAKYGLSLNATVDATMHGNKWISMETGHLTLINTGSMTTGTPHFQELYVHQGAVAGPADANENTLSTVTIPASYFTLFGGIKLVSFGDNTGAGGVKDIRVYFGGTLLGAALNVAAGTVDWRVEGEVWLPDSVTVQHSWIKGYDGTTLELNDYNSLAVNTTTGSVEVKVTCQKAAAGDTCRSRGLVVMPWR